MIIIFDPILFLDNYKFLTLFAVVVGDDLQPDVERTQIHDEPQL